MTRRITRRKIIMTVVALSLLALFFISHPRLLWHPYIGGSGCLEFKCGDDEHWFDAWCCPGGGALASVSIGYGWDPERGHVRQKGWQLESPWWRPPANAAPSRTVIIHNP